MPKSAVMVIESLKGSRRSMKDIMTRTSLPERTVRFAIHSLKKRGIVTECFDFSDMRRKKFRLAVGKI